jgi:hypothetical protein
MILNFFGKQKNKIDGSVKNVNFNEHFFRQNHRECPKIAGLKAFDEK